MQQRLKLYRRLPANGLVIFCGTVCDGFGGEVEKERGKQKGGGGKRLLVDFEPFRKVSRSLYLCGSQFHVEPLWPLMEAEDAGEAYGFIVVDGK